MSQTGNKNHLNITYTRQEFLTKVQSLHGDHFTYGDLPRQILAAMVVEPVCRVHGPFRISVEEHLNDVESGGCPKCKDKESLTAEEVNDLCRDTMPNAGGDPWTEEVYAPLPTAPVFAVSSRNGIVYDRIRRWKTGQIKPVVFTEGSDTHQTAELMGIEHWLGWVVITTHRPIIFQEGYWIQVKDHNPRNCDLSNLDWVEKKDYLKRFWKEMYEEDIEWKMDLDLDHESDSD